MASREPRRHNPAIPRNASTSLDPPGSRAAASSNTSSSVRRNLFPQAGAARRQLRHHDSASTSSTSTVRQTDIGGSSDNTNNDIIIRDPLNGSFTIDAPQVPLPQDPTLEDEEAEARRRMIEGWRKLGDGMVDQSGELDEFPNLVAREKWKVVIEHFIVVACWRQLNGYDCCKWKGRMANVDLLDAEIKAVLMASLEEHVQSLEDDGWMFGDEEKDEEQ